jgi:hypothetical protein
MRPYSAVSGEVSRSTIVPAPSLSLTSTQQAGTAGVKDVVPNPAEGVAGSGNTSLLQPTFEPDGVRVQCPTEPGPRTTGRPVGFD